MKLAEVCALHLFVCRLRVEWGLVRDSYALHGASLFGHGNRQLRSQPGVFSPKQGNIF